MDWEAVFATRAGRMQASEIRELLKLLEQPDIISFAGGIPDPALFPKEAFRQAYASVLADANAGGALQYSTSEGFPGLRDWVVRYMRAQGVACGPDNILITSGSQQALDYLGKLLLSPGDTALVTWPTYLGALQAFNAYEPRYDRLTPAHGNMTPSVYADAAAKAGGRVKFAYVNPDFGNPTGETLDRAARENVLDLAEDCDIAVIEDSAYQALRYDGAPVPSILALDVGRHDGIEATRTLLCGSFSKTLSPGLRLGWICAASAVIRKLVLTKQASDLHTPTINQMAMHHVAEHAFPAQVETVRRAYRHRRDRMLAALERHMPAGVSWTRPQGGMFIWVTLPEHLDAASLLAMAIETARIAFVPGRAFHADGTSANTLRLSFSLASDTAIDSGIERLGKVIREAAKAPRSGH